MTTMRVTEEQRESALTTLRSILTPGADVYVFQRHVSRSGMQRRLSLFTIDYRTDADPRATAEIGHAQNITRPYMRDITILVGQAAGFTLHSREYAPYELIADGAGMDMHFHVVYRLGFALFPDGVPSEHAKGRDLDNGGYALNKVTI